MTILNQSANEPLEHDWQTVVSSQIVVQGDAVSGKALGCLQLGTTLDGAEGTIDARHKMRHSLDSFDIPRENVDLGSNE